MAERVQSTDMQSMSSWSLLHSDMPYLRPIYCGENSEVCDIELKNPDYLHKVKSMRTDPEQRKRLKEITRTHKIIKGILIAATQDERGSASDFTDAIQRIDDAVDNQEKRTLYEKQLNEILRERHIDKETDEPMSPREFKKEMTHGVMTGTSLREDLHKLIEVFHDETAMLEAMNQITQFPESEQFEDHPYKDKPEKLAKLFYAIHTWFEMQTESRAGRTLYQNIEGACNSRLSAKARKEFLVNVVSTDEAIRDANNMMQNAGGLYELLRAVDLDGVWNKEKYADELHTRTVFAIQDELTGECIEISSINNLKPKDGQIIVSHDMPSRLINLIETEYAMATGRIKLTMRGLGKTGIDESKENKDYEGFKLLINKEDQLPVAVENILTAIHAKYPQAEFLLPQIEDQENEIEKTKKVSYQQNIVPQGFEIELPDGNNLKFPYSENGHNGLTSQGRKALKFYVKLDGKLIELQFQTIQAHLNSTYFYDRKDKPDFHEGYYMEKVITKLISKIFDDDYLWDIQHQAGIDVNERLRTLSDPFLLRLALEHMHAATWGHLRDLRKVNHE